MLFAYVLHTCNIQVSVAEEDRCVLPSIFNPKKLLCTCKVSSSPALHIPRVCPNRTHATTQASFRRGLCSHALAVAEHYLDGPSIERMSRKIFRERKSHAPKRAKPGKPPHLPHSSTPHPSLIQANPPPQHVYPSYMDTGLCIQPDDDVASSSGSEADGDARWAGWDEDEFGDEDEDNDKESEGEEAEGEADGEEGGESGDEDVGENEMYSA